MSNHDRHLSRRDAEEILASAAESDRAVGPVVDALAAPARESELLREDATVAAFHAARLTPAPISRSASSMSTPTRTAAKAFVATGAVVAVTSGGIALAATGHLPTLPDQASDHATEAVAKHATETSPTETATTTSEASTESTTESTTETTTEITSETPAESLKTDAAATPNLEGLCNAFQHGNRTEKGKSLDSAAFTALATAAGSKDAIATYCVSLIGEPEAEKTKPAHPVHPTKPTKAATPTKPAKPTKPALPSKASNPTKPEKPAQGGKPERVGKS